MRHLCSLPVWNQQPKLVKRISCASSVNVVQLQREFTDDVFTSLASSSSSHTNKSQPLSGAFQKQTHAPHLYLLLFFFVCFKSFFSCSLMQWSEAEGLPLLSVSFSSLPLLLLLLLSCCLSTRKLTQTVNKTLIFQL